MDRLKALLKERKVSLKDEDIIRKVQEFGFDPNNLSDENAQLVADELTKQQTAMVAPRTAEGIAAKPKATSNGKPPQTDESLKKALLHAFGEKQKELKAFEGQLGKHRQEWMNNWVQENLNTIHNTSNDAFELLKAELLKEEANAQSFLDAANALATELFATQ